MQLTRTFFQIQMFASRHSLKDKRILVGMASIDYIFRLLFGVKLVQA